MKTNMKRGLVDGYCGRCNKGVEGHIGTVQYSYDHPEHYDGVSEYRCMLCGRREGRWTGRILTGGASEPRFGVERDEVIDEEQSRKPLFTQPR